VPFVVIRDIMFDSVFVYCKKKNAINELLSLNFATFAH